MPSKYIFVISAILIITLTGCGGSGEENAGTSYTDLPEYQLEMIEVLQDQGDLILGRPVYTEIDSEGNRLVMDLSTFNIHVFDSDGVHRNSFGGQGNGPGEFQQPRRPLIDENNTMYISDNARRVLLVYEKTGNVEWSHAYDVVFPATEEGNPFYGFGFSEYGFPVVYNIYDEGSGEFPDGYSTIRLVSRDGEILGNTDVKFVLGKMINITSGENRISLGLSEIPTTVITPHYNGTYYQAWTGTPAIHQYRADGELLRTINLEGFPVQRATNQGISSLHDRMFPGGRFGNLTNELREAVGEHFAAFSQLMVIKDESLWLQQVDPESGNGQWYHLSPDGEPLGSLQLEEGFRLQNAQGNEIYASGTLEDGSPAIVKYRIEK